MVTVWVPRVVREGTFIVMVDVPAPVMDGGLKVTVTPEG